MSFYPQENNKKSSREPSPAPAFNKKNFMQNNDSLPNQPLSGGGNEGSGKDSSNGVSDFSGQGFEDRNGQHHPIAEFLYQLTKMLTDDNNEIIEWADGRIKVHHPERLEAEVLHKYFRHSKFASFQRQLNYFGFRKIAGKGKMSPCSYVNEAATSDIRSLLLIKRKTNGTAARKAALQQRAAALVSSAGVNPALAGMNFAALGGDQNAMAMLNGQALSNAMALLSENALRAGVGQLPLQQQNNQQLNLLALQQQHQRLQQQLKEQQQHQHQQQQMQQHSSLSSSQHNDQLMGMNNKSVTFSNIKQEDTGNHNSGGGNAPSLEQLHAHLAALSQQQQQNNILNQGNSNRSSLGGMSSLMGGAASQALGPASAALNPASAALNRATAALNAQQGNNGPATAAMDAASATAQTTNNLFESAANLKSLLNEHHQNEQAQNVGNGGTQSSLFNRLPSSSAIFPENMSTVSFGNLLGSSNRLNSLLSLNSFLGSREASLADFAAAMPPGMRDQLAAGANGVSQYQDSSKYRGNS